MVENIYRELALRKGTSYRPDFFSAPWHTPIVAGLVSRLFLGRIISPVLYQLVAREGDVLQM